MNPIRYRLGKRVLRIQTMGLYEPQKSSPYDFFKDMLDPVVETARCAMPTNWSRVHPCRSARRAEPHSFGARRSVRRAVLPFLLYLL